MDKFTDFFENIKERFSNPFLFSFIISWLICNWSISLALVWHDVDEIKTTGFGNTFEFIRHQLYYHHNLKDPIIFAILFSIGIPFVKNFIKIIFATAERFGNWGILNINNGASVPFEEHYKLELKIKDRENNLVEMIQNAGELRGKILTLEQTGRDNINNILELKKKIEIHEIFKQELKNTSFLDGFWTLQVKDDLKEHQARGWFIKDGKISLISEGVKIPHYIISNFYHDTDNKVILFIAIVMKNNTIIDVFKLSMNGEDYFTGFRNEKQITLTKGYLPLNLE